MTRKRSDAGPPGDYAVGYCRPPLATRFKPGQSGNARGRPKGVRNFNTEIEAELNARVPVTENGQKKMVTKRAIIAKQLVNKSAQGDHKGIGMLLQNERIAEQAARTTQAPATDAPSPEDKLVMASILRRIQHAPASPESNSSPNEMVMPDVPELSDAP